jgi:hypothetical protein
MTQEQAAATIATNEAMKAAFTEGAANAVQADEWLAQLAQTLGMLVFYDAPAMPLPAVKLAKVMLDCANIQIQVQMQTREKKPGAAAPSPPPAPERRKRGRRPRSAAAGNGAHPPAAVTAAPSEPPLFPEPGAAEGLT